ncbi:MAG: phosphotransferase, partial [Myxococcales bacterium]|nr:phosphotransferase [Myxococcales bacterium]
DGYNVTYRIDDRTGKRYALRVTRPGPTRAHVGSEVDWCLALGQETSVRVIAPVRNAEGDYCTEVEGRQCVLTEWLSGACRNKGLSPKMLRAVGVTMARMHDFAERWTPPAEWARPLLDTVWHHESPSPIPNLPAEAAVVFSEAEARLAPFLKHLTSELSFALHGDLHQWNYRFGPGHDVGVMDFDDCAVGHPSQDIAICFYYFQRHARAAALREAFQAGYCTRRPWPLRPGELSALTAWRALSLCGSVMVHENEKLRALVPELLPRWMELCRAFLEDDRD